MSDKKLEIVKGQSTMKKIQWSGGGQLPAELEGAFTSTAAAQQAIDVFKAKVTQRAIDNTPKLKKKPVPKENKTTPKDE